MQTFFKVTYLNIRENIVYFFVMIESDLMVSELSQFIAYNLYEKSLASRLKAAIRSSS